LSNSFSFRYRKSITAIKLSTRIKIYGIQQLFESIVKSRVGALKSFELSYDAEMLK
jgi:hypothetical protein